MSSPDEMTRPIGLRRARRLLTFGAVVALALAARPSAADAHAVFVGSQPADGESLASAPPELTVTFGEAVSLTAAQVELRDGRGVVVASTATGSSGAGGLRLAFDSGSTGETLRIGVPPLPRDVYQLRWRLVSADDYHPTAGALAFGIGQPAIAGGVTNAEQLPPTAVVVAGWIDLMAGALLIGALGVWQLVLPRAVATGRRWGVPEAPSDAVAARLVRIARRAAVATVATKLLLFGAVAWAATHWAGASGVGSAFGREVRRPTFVGAVACASAIVVLLGRGRARRTSGATSVRALLAAALAVAVLGLSAQESHIAGGRGGARLAVVTLTFHVLAAGFWVGGLTALAVVALPLRRQGPSARAFGTALFEAFGGPATASVAVLVISGLRLTGRQVASADAGLRSLYGHVLGAKLVLALGVGAIGLRVRATLRRPGASRLPRWGVVAEVAAGVVVLGAAAILAGLAPASGARYEATSSARTVASVSGPAVDLFVTAALAPNRPGRAFATIDVRDTRRPAPAAVTAVDLTWTEPNGAPSQTYAATRLDTTRWQVAGLNLAAAGEARLDVRIARVGLPDARFEHAWLVARPPVAVLRTLVSRRPLGPVLDLAAVLGFAVGVGAIVARKRRRRPAPDAVIVLADRREAAAQRQLVSVSQEEDRP